MAHGKADGEAGWHTPASSTELRGLHTSCPSHKPCCGVLWCHQLSPFVSCHGGGGRSDPARCRAAPARHVPAPPGRTSAVRARLRPLPGTGCAPGPARAAAGREGSRESRAEGAEPCTTGAPGLLGEGARAGTGRPPPTPPAGSAGPGWAKGNGHITEPGSAGQRGPIAASDCKGWRDAGSSQRWPRGHRERGVGTAPD